MKKKGTVMRNWLLVVGLLVIMATVVGGCGKSTVETDARPSAAEYQAELAELDRLEKDLASTKKELEDCYSLQTTLRETIVVENEMIDTVATYGGSHAQDDLQHAKKEIERCDREIEQLKPHIKKAEQNLRAAEQKIFDQRSVVEKMRQERRSL